MDALLIAYRYLSGNGFASGKYVNLLMLLSEFTPNLQQQQQQKSSWLFAIQL